MKTHQTISLAFFLSLLVMSCGGDENMEMTHTDFVGSWVMTSIRDDCMDPSNNVKVDAGENGYCQNAGNGGQECIMLHLEINADGSILLISQVTLIGGSIITPQPPTTSKGTFNMSENTIIATFIDGDVIPFMGDSSRETLDWIITITQAGCNRKWRFERE